MNCLINSIDRATPFHCHTDYEIIVCTKGNGNFYFEKEKVSVSEGTIIVVPPDTMHSCVYEEENERIYIKGEFNRVFNVYSPVVISGSAGKEGLILAKMIYQNRYGEKEYVSALVAALVQFLMQHLKYDSAISLAVKEVARLISENFYDYNTDLKLILNQSGYAEDYIRAKFKEIIGCTPVEFLTKIRINHACSLIDMYAKTMPLSEIAERCGFSDYVYFSRKFKRIKKISPREYMKSDKSDE